MLSCVNRDSGQNIKHLHPLPLQVAELYQHLSLALERLQVAQHRNINSCQQICLAILAEDLEALLEQCENYLYSESAGAVTDKLLIESLTQTVLEELSSILQDD